MNKTEKLIKDVRSLGQGDIFRLVFELLCDGKLDYANLSAAYVRKLEEDARANRMTINGLSIPLIQYWQGGKMMKNHNHVTFVKAKAAYHLLKGKVFHTAAIEKDLQIMVDEVGYTEDEHGLHNMLKQ